MHMESIGSLKDLPGVAPWIRGAVLLVGYCLTVGIVEQLVPISCASESVRHAWPYLLVSLFGSLLAAKGAPVPDPNRPNSRRRTARKTRNRVHIARAL